MLAGVYDGRALQVVDDVEIRDVRPGEVSVRVMASGVCQSDLSVLNGTIPFPSPVVLGHEGAGIVAEVGQGVTHVRVGDHVVIANLTSCGTCTACGAGRPTMCRDTFGRLASPFSWKGETAHAFATVGSFSERVVVKAIQAIPIPHTVPFPSAALIGCGVLTGVGAALNRARVSPGDTVVVIGAGGVGLNVAQGCRIARASRIIVVDANPAKEHAAVQFGATDFVVTGEGSPVGAVLGLTDGFGVDHAFECVGRTDLGRQAVEMLNWGGQAILLGTPHSDAEMPIPVTSLYLDKSVMGCRYGSARPTVDIPRYVNLYEAGALMLDELVSRKYELGDLGQVVEDMQSGVLNRGVLVMDSTC